jgi:hypothetical protein
MNTVMRILLRPCKKDNRVNRQTNVYSFNVKEKYSYRLIKPCATLVTPMKPNPN